MQTCLVSFSDELWGGLERVSGRKGRRVNVFLTEGEKRFLGETNKLFLASGLSHSNEKNTFCFDKLKFRLFLVERSLSAILMMNISTGDAGTDKHQ